MDLTYDNVVIGKSLEAILFSYYSGYPIVLTSTKSPYPFEDLKFELPNFFCRKKNEIWSLLLFEISLKGLSPFGADVTSIRVQENKMAIFLDQTKKINVSFERCFIFDNENISCGNNILSKEKPHYRVLDWFNVRSGASHDLEEIITPDEFVKEIYFYKSSRIDGDRNLKDLVAVSFLDAEQLNNFEYSDTMARFKIENLMKWY